MYAYYQNRVIFTSSQFGLLAHRLGYLYAKVLKFRRLTMLTTAAQGVFPIAPTPFLPDGRVDDFSTDRLIDHYLQAGANGITILGIMGEAPKLDQSGRLAIVMQGEMDSPANISRRKSIGWPLSDSCSV